VRLMRNYKTLMARVDKLIHDKNKELPLSTSGLLAPKGKMSKIDESSPEAQIAKYITIIRKQREELVK
jgi:hypothetical protein